MERKIKVHLIPGNLPLYKELVKHPPKGIDYYPKKTDVKKGIETYHSITQSLKRRLVTFAINKLSIPKMLYVHTDADIIHSNRGILILNKKPWVIDIDYVGYFFNGVKKMKDRNYRNKVLGFLNSEYCKKIIAWSNVARLSIVNSFDSKDIKNKTNVVYPATQTFNFHKERPKEKLRLLFVASQFYYKGGKEVLEAFSILRRKYDLELIVKSDVPKTIMSKYNTSEIKYYPYRTQLLSRTQLIKNFFAKSDIFVYPTHGDLFGLGLLDAMSVGLPIVTTNVFAIPEIVEDYKGGFIIKEPYARYSKNYIFQQTTVFKNRDYSNFVKQIVRKISLLIENPSLRRKMGRYNRKLVEKGKFSIKERNKKLKSIYEEALNY